MKKFINIVISLFLVQMLAFGQSPNIVISQVFGGAGCSTNTPLCNTPYTRDYIELFNRGSQSVNIGGYSLQVYDGVSWYLLAILPNQVINPGQYFSIGGIPDGGNALAIDPPVDALATFSLTWNSNNIALVKNSTLLNNCPFSYNDVVDKLGYGISPYCWEGFLPAGAPGFFDYAVYRKMNGCQDADYNYVDFVAAPATPRNLLTPAYSCPVSALPELIPSPAFIDGLVATATTASDSVYLELAGHNLIPSGNPTELLNVSPSPGVEICYDAGAGFNGIFYPGSVDWPYGSSNWTFRFLVRLSAGSVGNPFTGFITFTGGGASVTVFINTTVVPVKISGFNVIKQANSVKINWTTQQEINSKTFIVESSVDQRTWKEVTKIAATGNSYSARNYTATDFYPTKGMNYYRLKSVDLDNKYYYSEIRSVYFGDDEQIIITPNPVKDKLIIYLPANNKDVLIKLYNSKGQLVKLGSTNGEQITMNVLGMPAGIYLVAITGKNSRVVKRVVIQ